MEENVVTQQTVENAAENTTTANEATPNTGNTTETQLTASQKRLERIRDKLDKLFPGCRKRK